MSIISLDIPVRNASITSQYGSIGSRKDHNGVDFFGSSNTALKNAPIYAPANATIAQFFPTNPSAGKTLIITHVDGNMATVYMHLSAELNGVTRIGQRVNKGELIGYVGDTGSPGLYHLHFEVRILESIYNGAYRTSSFFSRHTSTRQSNALAGRNLFGGNIGGRNYVAVDPNPFLAPATAVVSPAPVATASAPVSQPASPAITVTVNGTPVVFETPPQMINDRVIIQIRPVAQRLGCNVVWDDSTQTSYINQPNTPLQRTAKKSNSINVYVNNKPIAFPDQKPIMHSGYVLVPSRAVIEALGHSVTWINSTRTQNIVTGKNT